MEHNHFSNFPRRLHKEYFCEIILKSGHWPRRRCGLNVFPFLALVAIFSAGTILAIFVEGHLRNISMKLF